MINSHIQMPKCVLKRFEDQNHRLFYYDVKKCIIGSNGHAGSLNTGFGFYSHNAEEFLNTNIEKPFSNLFENIDEIGINPPKGHINSQFDYTAKRFVYALLARNPNSVDRIKKYPFLTDILSSQQSRDAGMILGFAAEIDRDFLAPYGTTIAINTTEIPFVLPTCGVYYMKLWGSEHIFLPVSPQKAIIFVEEKRKDVIIHDGIVHPYSFDDIHEVRMCNMGALSTQCRYANGYVVSPSKEPLEHALRGSNQ